VSAADVLVSFRLACVDASGHMVTFAGAGAWNCSSRQCSYRPDLRSPVNSGVAGLQYALVAVFAADMLVSFRLAYVDGDGHMVTSARAIAWRYLSLRFWVDLVTTVPIDMIAVAALGVDHDPGSSVLHGVVVIGAIRLVRLDPPPFPSRSRALALSVDIGALSLLLMAPSSS
jgi:hypothetical protein